MRYINPRFTYLLTYLLTYFRCSGPNRTQPMGQTYPWTTLSQMDGHRYVDPAGYYASCVSNMHTHTHTRAHAHTHQFNGPFSGTTRVSRYQNGKTNLDFAEARDSE